MKEYHKTPLGHCNYTPHQLALFEEIYDHHHAMLFGIIIKMCHNKAQAEEILVHIFQNYFQQADVLSADKNDFNKLLKLTVVHISERTHCSKESIAELILQRPLLAE